MVQKAISGVASDMVLSPRMGAVEDISGGSGLRGSSADLVSGISAAISEALGSFAGQQGDIMIPVYIGGTLLDEVIVTAQARQNLRSGGR